ncbi:hypothetical protein Tco_0201952 [Tanacetum coccineum]
MAVAAMSVEYVLTTPIPEDDENATVEQIRKRVKWDNDDYDSLEAKYMAEDASSKKFFVSNFTNYKMTNSRPVKEQYNELFDFKHKKHELTLVELGSHLRVEESLRAQDSDKPKGNNVIGPQKILVSSGILNNCGYKQETESEFDKFVLSKHGTRDEVSDQPSYCFNVEDDPKTFDEEMKSHDLLSRKEAINDERTPS